MTRAFALEALDVALAEARRFAVAAKLDEHFVSDIDHLTSVCRANKGSAHADSSAGSVQSYSSSSSVPADSSAGSLK